MLKVLFIEDKPETIETLIEELKKVVQGFNHKTENFDDAESALQEFLPDLVVLDVFRGDVAEGDTAGLVNYNFIWDKCFCPIVVYSALPEGISANVKEHPFVQLVQKGLNTEFRVISCIEEFLPHIKALNEVQNNIRQHVNRELRNIAPLVFPTTDDVGKKQAFFVRAARRRIAAMMDTPLNEEIVSWEQYLYPPAGSNLLVGDLIKKRTGDGNEPKNYCLVLTPSCDLVDDEERTPNVDKALVACCADIKDVLSEVNAEVRTRPDKLKNLLLPFLRRGYGNFCLPLPEFPGVLPAMAVKLKKLELIELDKIGNDDECEYCRVVSVDSPFREMITWAYLQTTGRPGLPKRNFEAWAEDICSSVVERGRQK